MSDAQQSALRTPGPAAEAASEMVVSQSEGPALYRWAQLQKDRQISQSSLDTLHQQRVRAVDGLQKLNQQIEMAILAQNVGDSTKLTSLHAKRRTFEQRLDELASQEEILTRHLDNIARQEQEARVENAAKSRQELQTRGAEVATKLRQGLAVVGQLFSEWRELKERERIAKDVVRSLAPNRMGECPDFSFATAVDPNFEHAVAVALVECHKSLADLGRRDRPLPPEMQRRIDREQGVTR